MRGDPRNATAEVVFYTDAGAGDLVEAFPLPGERVRFRTAAGDPAAD